MAEDQYRCFVMQNNVNIIATIKNGDKLTLHDPAYVTQQNLGNGKQVTVFQPVLAFIAERHMHLSAIHRNCYAFGTPEPELVAAYKKFLLQFSAAKAGIVMPVVQR